MFVLQHTARFLSPWFDEPCMAYYNADNVLMYIVQSDPTILETITNSDINVSNFVTAPLYQQVINWFREKRNLHLKIMVEDGFNANAKIWNYDIINIDHGGDREVYCLAHQSGFVSYDAALNAGISHMCSLIV